MQREKELTDQFPPLLYQFHSFQALVKFFKLINTVKVYLYTPSIAVYIDRFHLRNNLPFW